MSNYRSLKKYFIALLLVAVIVISSLTAYMFYPRSTQAKANPNVNVGIAFCGNTTAEAKLLIDRTKSYTNLFVLASGGGPISHNRTQIEEICDYAVSQGLKIIMSIGTIYIDSWFWKSIPIEEITDAWQQRWGDNFLGIYYNDEPAGIQLDGDWDEWFRNYSSSLGKVDFPAINTLAKIYPKIQALEINGTTPENYDLEAYFFIQNVLKEDPGLMLLKNTSVKTCTSDYCLYWFDYLGGYDTMFAELGWNHSVTQQISLVKGAARLQDKDWGTILTWKYRQEPYLDSGEEIYNQMLTSYQAGAKYIILFNYPILGDYGVMKDEHFVALERFWNDITTKSYEDLSQSEAVLVLPSNYGWGMRNPTDNIWGFYPTDEKSQVIWDIMSSLLSRHGASLDIVYDDPEYPISTVEYKFVYYWNQTLPT